MAVETTSATSLFMSQSLARLSFQMAPATARSFSCSSGVGVLSATTPAGSTACGATIAGAVPAVTTARAAPATASATADLHRDTGGVSCASFAAPSGLE
ncbi:hypothetical protein [Streptomyces sp. NPDC050804]|uniref:hypothetical protein n=1 Tax=Streptomyces sp. NPDC050804 TaxID=3154745 RepID=UPI003427D8C6